MKRLSAILACLFLVPAFASAATEVRLKVSINKPISIQALVTEMDHGQVDPAIGSFQVVGDAKVVEEKGGVSTHEFEMRLPKDLSEEDLGKLIVTIIEDPGEFRNMNPIGYGLTLCSMELREIPDRHIQLELAQGELDVTGYFRPDERLDMTTEGQNGFRNGEVARARQSDDGRVLVGWRSTHGNAEIRIATMAEIEKRAKAGMELQWKTWTGTVAKDKPTIWTEKKN